MSLVLAGKSLSFWASVSNECIIFEGFTATFCSSEDKKVLLNDTVKVWKTGMIGGYEDRLVSTFFDW